MKHQAAAHLRFKLNSLKHAIRFSSSSGDCLICRVASKPKMKANNKSKMQPKIICRQILEPRSGTGFVAKMGTESVPKVGTESVPKMRTDPIPRQGQPKYFGGWPGGENASPLAFCEGVPIFGTDSVPILGTHSVPILGTDSVRILGTDSVPVFVQKSIK